MRWRLTQPHYLKVPDTEWEYKEVSRETGKQARKVFAVPALLEADTIVCYEGKGQHGDTIFEGDPTPDMEPLDDEARELSATFADRWKHPIDSLPENGYGAELIGMFERQMQQLLKAMPNQPAPNDEVAELKAQVAALTERLSALTEAPKPTGRRV